MITTEINIQDYVQLSEQEIDDITLAAKEDCVRKLDLISDDYINESNLHYQFELICKVKVTLKPKTNEYSRNNK